MFFCFCWACCCFLFCFVFSVFLFIAFLFKETCIILRHNCITLQRGTAGRFQHHQKSRWLLVVGRWFSQWERVMFNQPPTRTDDPTKVLCPPWIHKPWFIHVRFIPRSQRNAINIVPGTIQTNSPNRCRSWLHHELLDPGRVEGSVFPGPRVLKAYYSVNITSVQFFDLFMWYS